MSAIFGFTFHIGRMTEVLTPDIYVELTALMLDIPIQYYSAMSRDQFVKSLTNSCTEYKATRLLISLGIRCRF